MNCVICGHPAVYNTKYCARCKRFILNNSNVTYRRPAMQRAWSPENDCFLCYYTGELLDDLHPQHQFYLTFDHLIPGDMTKLEVASRHINELKGAMTEREFHTNIPMLANHFETGEPINPDNFKIEHFWHREKPAPVQAENIEPLRWISVDACIICGHPPLKGRYYCARCLKLLTPRYPVAATVNALRNAYDKEMDGFRCHYTGVLLDLDFPSNRWHISYDHQIPGKPETIVMAAICINKMKERLSGDEFIAVVKELAHHFTTGKPYNQNVIKFEYW